MTGSKRIQRGFRNTGLTECIPNYSGMHIFKRPMKGGEKHASCALWRSHHSVLYLHKDASSEGMGSDSLRHLQRVVCRDFYFSQRCQIVGISCDRQHYSIIHWDGTAVMASFGRGFCILCKVSNF